VQRFRCLECRKSFSRATFHPCFRQHKRQFNTKLEKFLSSGLSQRRLAMLFHLSRTTVAKKFCFLGEKDRKDVREQNIVASKVVLFQFDDLETFEHSRYKPLAVLLVVEEGTRRIIDFEVSQMAPKGRYRLFALKKYGPRKDKRKEGRRRLFERIKPFIHPQAVIKSDENPHYVGDVRTFFPEAQHKRYKGQRGSMTGQGELKKVRFDPIFSLNHTCAMLRGNINRLFRKTWCTTKVAQRLEYHLAIYAKFHNTFLIDSG